jgi:hypothetical protein
MQIYNTTNPTGGLYLRTYRIDSGNWVNNTNIGLWLSPILYGFDDGTSTGGGGSGGAVNYIFGD